MKRALSILVVIIGSVLVGAAIVYFVTPANSLPSFLPGHDPGLTKIHLKHGIASFVVGVCLWTCAWLLNRKKSRGLIA